MCSCHDWFSRYASHVPAARRIVPSHMRLSFPSVPPVVSNLAGFVSQPVSRVGDMSGAAAAIEGVHADQRPVPLSPSVRRLGIDPDATLDRFQTQAIDAVTRGMSVLVSAPTGAGKTVVAEAALWDAAAGGGRAFYTTPIKALSNQKFADLSGLFGEQRVGLLTGDNSIRPDADIVVMTTEVLRNMIYSDRSAKRLNRLRWVVLDEVHYLGDPYRGGVWEEVIIGAPADTKFVCLSATVSNVAEFGRWLSQERGDVEVVVSKARPVPLVHRHAVADSASADPISVFPSVDRRRRFRRIESTRRVGEWYGDYDYGEWRYSTPTPDAVIGYLKAHDRLPVLYFVFSRAGCDTAARGGFDLTTPEEKTRIAGIAERRLQVLDPSERDTVAGGRMAADAPRRRRRPPRRARSHRQRSGGRVFHRRAGQGRVRYRNARGGDEHARPDDSHRQAHQVQRDRARRSRTVRVHTARRTGGQTRHRQRRAVRDALVAVCERASSGIPRIRHVVPASVPVRAELQHGRQPGRTAVHSAKPAG